jgi:hypothetical protein
MGKTLLELVLPRLAQPLYRHLEQFQTGVIDDSQFSERFEAVLSRQHSWLSKKGVTESRAAVAIHAAVLILSRPGLRLEAEELGLPVEVLEMRAVRESAEDVARCYGMPAARAADAIADLCILYGDYSNAEDVG